MADKKQTMLYGLLTSIASKITYDNTTSGLEADNVQDAIDEVNANLMQTPAEETLVGTIVIQGVTRNRYRRVISTNETITQGVFSFATQPLDVDVIISITGSIYCSSGASIGHWLVPYWYTATDFFFNHSWGTIVCQHSSQVYTGAFQIIDYCKQGG